MDVLKEYAENYFSECKEEVQQAYRQYEQKLKELLERRLHAREIKKDYDFKRIDTLIDDVKSTVNCWVFLFDTIDDIDYEIDVNYLSKQMIFHSDNESKSVVIE